ncbi:hypothetical protein CDL15_Pgr009752 [Punica granatum]|uniref:ABC transporter B family member 26, chloroplastic n=1 Tax=Punica granatum TaxID=22663 RepID=A0A218WU34_PUNGR|nr:hypothetical protein CDL15_Pgr009752 [Punica granatum]
MALLHLCDPPRRLLLTPFHHPIPLLSKPATATPRRRDFPSGTIIPSSSHRLYTRRRLLRPCRCALPVNGAIVQDVSEPLEKRFVGDKEDAQLLEKLRRLLHLARSLLPGGSWWDLSEEEVDVRLLAKPVTVWRALTRMWELVAQDRWVIFAAFSALILAALSEISIPHYLTASIFSAQSANIAVFHRNVRLLILFCVIAGICSGLRGCCFGIANMILVKRMRETLYSSLLSQDISFFDGETVGDLTSRLGADCQQVSRVIGNDLNLILRNLLQGTGSLIYLLILSLPLGLCTLAVCLTLAAVMLTYGQYQKKSAKLIQEFTASANQVAQETFSLVRTIRVYGTENQEIQRYKNWLDKLANISLRQSAAYGFWNFSFNTLYHSMQVIAVLVGGISILSGRITTEQLTKFILYSSKLQRLLGRIEFVDVSFHYPSREMVPVLQHVNLSINPGEVVAIVGLSGSGKSTLVSLLLRLYEPTYGQVLIDGIPIKELDIKWLRERTGFVGQEPRLFRMDISSNIKYGCPRDVKQEDVEQAAKLAYAHDFICALPNAYQTIVDDDLLSGGQKQRIAIARAILRDPSILVLDEATSALDAESEHNVKGVLRAVRSDLMMRRTVIVIAHRLSTIQAADRIVVMDGGRIAEMGTHKELLLKDGLYARLTRRQADAVA